MATRRVTLGRVLVLLLVGVGIGVGIFLMKHLSPEELRRRVYEALEEHISAEFRFDEVQLDLNGVEVLGLVVYYPDKTIAISARRVLVAISQLELLGGQTVIKQITLSGVRVHLRPNKSNIPGLPGILKVRERAPTKEPMLFPIVVNTRAGQNRITLHGWPDRKRGLPLELDCRELVLRPQGDRYELTAEFSGDRVDRIELDGIWEAAARTLRINAATVRGLSWDREHTRSLARLLPIKERPPVELGGVADLTLNKPLVIRSAGDLLDIDATAKLRNLDGNFGNVYTFGRHGLPFRVGSGRCDVSFAHRRLEVSNLRATFASGRTGEGVLTASYERDFGRPGKWEDFAIRGRDIHTEPHHLELLLPETLAPVVVGPLAPGGTFDFEVTVSNRPGFPEKVNADVRLRDGRFEYANFPYLIDKCSAHIRVETNVAKPRGACDIVEFTLERGPDVWTLPVSDEMCVRGRGRIETYIRDWAPEDNPEVQDIHIRIANLPFDKKLERALALAEMDDDTYRAFQLGGRAHRVEVRVVSDDFGVLHDGTEYRIDLKGCTAAYKDFPLPLYDLSGTVIRRSHPPLSKQDGRPLPELEFENLRALARGGGRVRAHGQMRGGVLEVLVEAEGLTLGKELKTTLEATDETGVLKIWDNLRPGGKIDLTVHFDPERGEQLAIWVDLAGTTDIEGYNEFRYPLHGLEGTVFYHDHRVELSAIKVRAGEARVTLDGFHEAKDGVFNVYGMVVGKLENKLLAALNPVLGSGAVFPAGFQFEDGSQMRYEVWSARPTPHSDLQTQMQFSEVVLRATVKGVPLCLEGGTISSNDTRVGLKNMRLSMEGSDAAVDIVEARWPLIEDGSVPSAELRAEGLDPHEHLGRFLGEGMAKFLGSDTRMDLPLMMIEWHARDASLKLNGTVDLHRVGASEDGLGLTGIIAITDGWLQPDPPRGGPARFRGELQFKHVNVANGWAPANMRGVMHVDDCHLTENFILRGRVSQAEGGVFDYFVEEVELDIDYELNNLRLSRIDGRFHAGRLQGEIVVHTADPAGYDVHVTGKGVDLRNMLEPFLSTDDPLTGNMDFRIDLQSLSGRSQDQTGRATVRVREGQLFEVPVVGKLISLLSRVTPIPQSARFTDAVADVVIRGDIVKVRKLHLSTATNDVHLKGRISLYGDLDLDVRPQVTRLLDLPRLIDIPVLSSVVNLWHEIAYEIRLEGTVGSPALRIHALPWLSKAPPPLIQSPHAGRIKRMRPRVLP